MSHTCKLSVTDLYNSTHTANSSSDAPHGGWASNRVYNTHMYAQLAQDVIRSHGRDKPQAPMFLYMAFQNSHAPYQAPAVSDLPCNIRREGG